MSFRIGVPILLFCLTALSACAQLKTRSMTKDEIAASKALIASSLVPGIAGPLHIEEAQSFYVEGAGFESFSLVPVHYRWREKEASTSSEMCGVFVVHASHALEFLQTVGMGWLNVFNCDSLEAVGFMDANGGAPPRILVLYTANTPHDIENEPAVLDWSLSSRKYVWNETLSTRLAADGKTSSILEIKRQLRSYMSK